MKQIVKTVDSLCRALWYICRFSLLALFRAIGATTKVIAWAWGVLGKIKWLNMVWSPFNSFFKFCHGMWNSRMGNSIKAGVLSLVSKVDTRMEKSRIYRRTFMVFAIVLTGLFLYPPSHWGPWCFYQKGISSHYGRGFYFRRTANGDLFLPFFYTAAHRTLPLGITAKVVNLKNGKTVYVLINDRGPYVNGRILDLSTAAAKKIGLYEPGTGVVEIYTHKNYLKK